MRRCGDGIIADCTDNDVVTVHDNGKEREELEKSGASICDLRPSEIKTKLDRDKRAESKNERHV